MNAPFRAPALFIGFGLLAALALQPRLGEGTAAFVGFLVLGAVIVWGTAAPSASPVSPPLLAALAGAVLLAGTAWLFQRPLFPTALLLALVLFVGRHPALPLPGRQGWVLVADLVSGFLLGVLAAGRPGELAPTVGAGHFALAYAGLLLVAGPTRPLLGHLAWLAFHLLGAVMVGLKFYPLLAFLPFCIGTGTALYYALTRPAPAPGIRRGYAGIALLLGLILLGCRLAGL